MSYQIYYDRAYISIGDKYIPLVNSGSNNCWEFYGRREVPEKNWNVLNWKHSGQFIFTEAEIKEIALEYDLYNQDSGMMFKSRYRHFAPGEFERWAVNGMKRAYTVEEYVSFGNEFFVLDYSAKDTKDWKSHTFRTTEELINLLDSFKNIKSVDIKFFNNREVHRPKANGTLAKKLGADDLAEYYVLKGEYNGRTIYLCRLKRKRGFAYTWECSPHSNKIFETEKKALLYLKKYNDRLKQVKLIPTRIIPGSKS